MARAGSIEVDIRANSAQFVREMRRTGQSVRRMDRTMNQLKTAAIAVGGALAASFGARAAQEVIDYADSLDKLNQQLGFSEETLSALRFVAEQTGSSFETFTKGIQRQQRSLADARNGLTTALRAYQQLGVDINRISQLSPEQQFFQLAQALSLVQDQATRTDIASQIFGRAAGQNISGAVRDWEAFVATFRRAFELGGTFTAEQADNAARFNDNINELATASRGEFGRFVDQFLPWLNRGLEVFTANATSASRASAGLQEAMSDIVIDQGQAPPVFDPNQATLAGIFPDYITEAKKVEAENQRQHEELMRMEEEYHNFIRDQERETMAIRQAGRQEMEAFFTDSLLTAAESGFDGLLNLWAQTLQRMAAEALAQNLAGAILGGGGGGFLSAIFGGGGAAAIADNNTRGLP